MHQHGGNPYLIQDNLPDSGLIGLVKYRHQRGAIGPASGIIHALHWKPLEQLSEDRQKAIREQALVLRKRLAEPK